MKGIYYIKFNNKYYIGKDFEINKLKRIKEHINILKKNSHYNTYLQRAYNKYGHANMEYGVLKELDCSKEELSEIEKEYIQKYDSYHNGYNLTLGGEGGLGIIISEEAKKARSERTAAEKNPQAKLTNEQFFEIVELLKSGKTNAEIAEIYNLHSQYVSLIRHKKRFQSLWKHVQDYSPEISKGESLKERKISENMFLEIVDMIRQGETNTSIERKYNLSAGTVSRIRHRKTHKEWWERLVDVEERSTTRA